MADRSAVATNREPPREQMLRRRVLSLAEYTAELREPKSVVTSRLRLQFGLGVPPQIPVPLAPGESEAQYEARFRRANPLFAASHRATKASGERGARFLFAQKMASEYEEAEWRRCGQRAIASPRRPGKTPLPREVLYTTRWIPLEEYRHEYKTIKRMTKDETLQRFGVLVTPIFVPLARGESKEQYEMRFIAWIARDEMTLNILHENLNDGKERALRGIVAMKNASTEFAPHDATAASANKRQRDESSGGSNRAKLACPSAAEVVDLTMDTDDEDQAVKTEQMHSEDLRNQQ